MNSILIVRLSALGDTALTLPLFSALSQMMPVARIGWVIDQRFAPLLQDLPGLHRIHLWKKTGRALMDFRRLVLDIRSQGYQVSIDPQGLMRSAILPFLAGIPKRVGFVHGSLEGRELSPLLTNSRVSVPPDRTHVSQRSLYLGTALGLSMPKTFPVHLPAVPKCDRKIQHWWISKNLSDRTLVFGIGAGWPTKIWAVKEMSVLVNETRRLGYEVVVLWGPKEKEEIRKWQAELGNRALWAPETDIQEMISLLRLCRAYAGPDSAALHLAWLLGKPTFSWFGASDPARCAPKGNRHAFIAEKPHNWRRKKFFGAGLENLKGEEALSVFNTWLLTIEKCGP